MFLFFKIKKQIAQLLFLYLINIQTNIRLVVYLLNLTCTCNQLSYIVLNNFSVISNNYISFGFKLNNTMSICDIK